MTTAKKKKNPKDPAPTNQTAASMVQNLMVPTFLAKARR